MKKLNQLVIILLSLLVLSSCGGINKMKKNADQVKYEVTPKILETHGGEVEFSVKGVFPEKYFDKKALVEGTPVLVYANGETAFNTVTLQGEKIQANNKEIQYVTGGNFSHSDKVAFTDDMRKSELILRIKASKGSKSVDFDPVKLADGVIATSTLVQKDGKGILVGDKFKRIVPDSKTAEILYLINRAEVRPVALRAEDIKMLEEFIKAAQEAENKEFTGFEISAYASPDGAFDLNERLSKQRKESANRYFSGTLNKSKVTVDDSKLTLKSTPEDWEGFKTLVEASDIKDKDLIIRVLSMYSDPAVREKEIRNMAATFEVLADDILPQLRRAVLNVNIDVIGYSDEELLDLIDSDPAKLNLEEILYAAKLTEDLAKKGKVYAYAAERYPDCFRAYNGMGYVCLKQGKLDEAEKAFEDAKALMNNDVVKNNLGFVALLKGDIGKAEELFNSVEKTGYETNYGLGTIAIVKGNYTEAQNFLKDKPSYNLALAYLLKDDATSSKNILASVDSDNKWVHYLKAVTGARLEDETFMANNLRSAVAQDAGLKDYAKTDMEFYKYFASDTFKSIVE